MERWMYYGAPLSDAKGTVVKTEGPPGTTLEQSTAATAWVLSPLGDDKLPPLEIRLVDPDAATLFTLPVTSSSRSGGIRGSGLWVRAEVGPAAAFEYFVGSEGRDDEIRIKTDPAEGASPSDALPAVDLIEKLPGNTLQLAIQGGPVVMPPFQFDANEISTAAKNFGKLVRALTVVQRHTLTRVTIPQLSDLSGNKAQHILRMAALLDGQRVTGTFSSYPVSDDEFFAGWDETERPLIIEKPISVTIGGTAHETQMIERQHLESVWLDRSTSPPTLRPGSSNVIWSEAGPRATPERKSAPDGA